MNKQNVYRDISLVNCKQIKIPAKPAASQMSFRNINAKSFFQQQREATSRSPATTKRNKTNTNRVQTSIVHTEASESVINSQNNNLMEAFRLERESLLNTVKLYRQQIELLTHQNAKLKKQAKSRNRQGQRDEVLKYQVQKRLQLSKKVQEYQNMLPKLEELEHMSQKIIGQNNTLKTKIKVQQALLNNVANMAKCEENKSPTIQRICTLTQAYLKTTSNGKRSRGE